MSPQGHVYVSWFDQSFYPLIARSTDLGSTWETDSLAFFCTTIRACSTGVIASELGRGFKRSTDIVGVEEVTSAPSPGLSFQLSPNPFLKRAVINYSLPDQREVTIKVFDLTGRLIRVVERGMRKEGTHRLYWDGKNWAGEEISAGIYFVRLEVSAQEPRTLSLVKLPN